MKVLRALLALTLTGCHAASPLDESPQLDLDSGLAGAWRCMLADVEETDEAWVTVRHFRSRHSTAAQQFRVVKDQSRWISLGPILKMSPA